MRGFACFFPLRVSLIILVALGSVCAFTLDELQNLTSENLAAKTSLNFSSIDNPNELTGPIPPEIGQLTNLTFLSLSYLNLSGPIPYDISNLRGLTFLDLSFCGLSGQIPSELGTLTSLEVLKLAGNSFFGPIPSQLGNLVNLTQLDLSRNSLSGQIPQSLGSLQNLTHLNLYENGLSGPIPVELTRLSKSQLVALQSNQINGSIPQEIGNLTDLQDLALQNNQLSGNIPPQLGNVDKLTNLFLWNNNFSGPIPPQIGNLSELVNIYSSNNSLSGHLPSTIGALPKLENLDLQNNSLSGDIPNELGNLTDLQLLDLGNNSLSGEIPESLGGLDNLVQGYLFGNNLDGSVPPALGNLTSLVTLYLNDNHLSGNIPVELAEPADLQNLQLQYNNLTGGVNPAFIARFGASNILIGNPGLSISADPPLSTRQPIVSSQAPLKKSDGDPLGAIIGSIVGGILLLLLAYYTLAYIIFWRRKSELPLTAVSSELRGGQPVVSSEFRRYSASREFRRFLGGIEPPSWGSSPRKFTLAELRAATEDFAAALVVGTGSFGTVYRGVLGDRTVVAVKRLDQRRERSRRALEDRSWAIELATLSRVRHKNLVRMLGVCVEEGERLLVLEFFPGGSLSQRLQSARRGQKRFLSWEERMRVVEGVCRGLTYMHHDIHPPLLHRDIKAANILLKEGGGEACIADFGLTRLMEGDGSGNDSTSVVKGTVQYVAPEYLFGGQGFLSTKCDVYSFGVLLLELLSGRPVTEGGGGHVPPLVEWHNLVKQGRELEIVDPSLGNAFALGEATCCIGIALACLQRDPFDRPTMEAVRFRLQKLKSSRRGRSSSRAESPQDILSELARSSPNRQMRSSGVHPMTGSDVSSASSGPQLCFEG